MFVFSFFFFLAVMLFPSVGSGVMAPWSVSTTNLKVLLNYINYFYLVFIFGSFCLKVMLSASLHLRSVAVRSDQQKDDMMHSRGQNEFLFMDSWVHLKRNRCSFSWKGFISKVELKVFLNSSFYFYFISIFVYF